MLGSWEVPDSSDLITRKKRNYFAQGLMRGVNVKKKQKPPITEGYVTPAHAFVYESS